MLNQIPAPVKFLKNNHIIDISLPYPTMSTQYFVQIIMRIICLHFYLNKISGNQRNTNHRNNTIILLEFQTNKYHFK